MCGAVHRARQEAVSCVCFQGKTIIQAEIDAAPELIDFLRFNVMFAAVSESRVQ
jgi:hypothetical protein